MANRESAELIELYTTYTAGADSIGKHLSDATAEHTDADPLIVTIGTDLALYPGGGRDP